MKLLEKIFDFYLDASIHVAIAVYCLIRVSAIFLNISPDNHVTYYVFFATIACYNFIKYGVEAEKYILVANRYHKNIQVFSFVCLAFAVYHAYFLNQQTWMAIGFLIVLTGLYALPILPTGIKLRSHGLIKITLVGLIWAGTTVSTPNIGDRCLFFLGCCHRSGSAIYTGNYPVTALRDKRFGI